ncbi:hypothetical protein J437_LFUL017364 [Ladona fulva]|uniref:DUF5641 domain-containing protein n=1 Tax=Ladona fulva TaxID=123851 RepID=A0A8K0KQU8_LADFU|nr:hypothetical protein J437_LFUL017364 [Ladona fulva]
MLWLSLVQCHLVRRIIQWPGKNCLNTLIIQSCWLGGFPLDKWASNSKEFMNTCSGDNVESHIYFDGDDFTRVKILGLFWDMNADVFSYKINFPQITNSKRMLLSNIARIFDPIGGLSPIVFWCKCLLQSLWKLNIGWDEPVPLEHIRTVGHKAEMSSMFLDAGIEWKFNPPAALHFGGLWEAGIKSIKEVLNSRPLVPLSADPSEINCLTPGHFLIGQLARCYPRSQDLAATLSARWKLVKQIKNNFCRRWSNEYLHTLQQQAKWLQNDPQVQPGTLYLVRVEFASVVLANG